jgi:glycosyltransferase involved in cell wall biosynthesis
MRILHVIPSLQKGGAERLALDIVRALKRIPGTDVRLAVMSEVNEYAEEYSDIKPEYIRSKVVPSLSGKWNADTTEWERILDTFKPDVVHSHLFEAEMLSRYRIRPRITYVTHCHDNMHQLKRLRFGEWFTKKRITEAYERLWMMKQYREAENRFLAISPDTLQYFKRELPSDITKDLYLFPNAVDISRFSRHVAAYSADAKIQLINVGSFVAKKNQAFLLGVVQELNRLGKEVECVLAGNGPLREMVMQAAEKLGLSGQVKFPGNVSAIEHLLAKSHVYVHSATYEPFGLVLLEAMSAGLPVVCLDGHGNRELIREGENGFMVNPPDAKVFARRILDCVSSVETWNHFSTAAKDFVKPYDIEIYAQRLVRLYEEAQPVSSDD